MRMRFRSKKTAVAILLSLLVGGGAAYAVQSQKDPVIRTQPPQASQKGLAPEQKAPPRIRIIATGDMLPHGAVNQQAKKQDTYDYKPMFENIQDYFQSSDIRICNQESPSAPNIGVTSYPSFNAPPEFARDLASVGCNVVGLANNHLNDKGQAGIDGTRALWDEIKPLAVAGANRNAAEQQQVAHFELKGVKFAFVAYSEISNNNSLSAHGLNRLQEDLIRSQLNEARSKADFVFASVHWGTEYSQSENAAQKRWAKVLADNGADFVFGSGPHVLQPVAKLPKGSGGETIVYYSLGNLLSTQIETESLIGGLAVIDIDPQAKQVQKVGFLPTYMHYEWTADQKAREDLLARKNLKLYPLDQAAEPLAKSQNNTTVEAQLARVTQLLNAHTAVEIIKSDQF